MLKDMNFKGQKFKTVTITNFLFYNKIKLEFLGDEAEE